MSFSQNKEITVYKYKKQYSFCNSVDGSESGKTAFYTSCDQDNWYFTFECEENFFSPKYFNYNEPLYEGDIAELMITLGDKNRYLEVEVNQNNASYCAVIDNLDGQGNININFLDKNIIKSRIKLAINKWICDIIIPFGKLKELGFDENDVYFNAHRQDYDENGALNLYSLNPALSHTFHKPDAFMYTRFV